jgi:hypothetical protein
MYNEKQKKNKECTMYQNNNKKKKTRKFNGEKIKTGFRHHQKNHKVTPASSMLQSLAFLVTK